MRILVNQDEISIFKKNIMSHVDIIEESIKKMEALKYDLLWEGKSSITYKNKYNENIGNLKNNVSDLIKYIDFLDVFNSRYNKAQDNINVGYKKLNGGRNG